MGVWKRRGREERRADGRVKRAVESVNDLERS